MRLPVKQIRYRTAYKTNDVHLMLLFVKAGEEFCLAYQAASLSSKNNSYEKKPAYRLFEKPALSYTVYRYACPGLYCYCQNG
jgi:hypothetical protein